MTTEEMVMMRLKGASYREIGEACGISYQAVYDKVKRKCNEVVTGVRGKGFNIDTIVYKGIYEFFEKNEYECVSSFAEKIFGAPGRNMTRMRDFLTGKTDAFFKLSHIQKICELVGKPFEEVFADREAEKGR